MNRLHGLLAIGLVLSLATGCSRAAKSDHAPAPAAAPAAGTPGEMKAGSPLTAGRALVVTIDVALTVVDVDQSRATLRAEVERAGGYVADATSTGSGPERSAQLELRVPSDKIQGVRAALARAGEITTDVEKVQDVTEERADLDARLKELDRSQSELVKLQWELQSEKDKLVKVLDDAKVDETKSRQAADALMQRENAIKAVHLALLVRIKNILTPAQQETLRAAREADRCAPASATTKDAGRD